MKAGVHKFCGVTSIKVNVFAGVGISVDFQNTRYLEEMCWLTPTLGAKYTFNE